MPNPSTDSSTPYALKPDFSFAFKDWIKGGVECLIWGFKGKFWTQQARQHVLMPSTSGEYSVVCTLGILRHLFKYLAEYFATSGRLPCALLLLQDLNPKVARELQTQDTTAMRRCGTDIFDPELKTALSDVVFLESDTTEAGAQIIERLWDDGEAIDEDCGRDRALRRLKADIAANDRALRRLTAEANGVTSTPAPMLFTRGPPSHIRVRDAEASPAPTFLCSPTSSRSHSYSSMHHQASSNSASTASLNTLEDISDESAVPQIRPVGIADDNDSVPKSSEMLSKPLSPTENLRSRYHELL
ncbi:hypothetical protein QFC19_001977 [Naganishia cerealis]|uniref:Uncharacterized protein n=1 Tax=Naganishia cerealis TaxID=610337 RepID=A0ACC2WDL2_9TREE|nr:hypothetical protein QFC19_001977 [Naganishia cerealis]